MSDINGKRFDENSIIKYQDLDRLLKNTGEIPKLGLESTRDTTLDALFKALKEPINDPYKIIPALEKDYSKYRFIGKDGNDYPDTDSLTIANEEWKRRNIPFKLPNGDYFYGDGGEFLAEERRIKEQMNRQFKHDILHQKQAEYPYSTLKIEKI